jgi:hypothetical protein
VEEDETYQPNPERKLAPVYTAPKKPTTYTAPKTTTYKSYTYTKTSSYYSKASYYTYTQGTYYNSPYLIVGVYGTNAYSYYYYTKRYYNLMDGSMC